MEQLPKKEKLSVVELVDQLERLQEEQNEGRGVSVVRAVVSLLRNGKIREAQLVASHDHDKIRNYPEIQDLLREQLFDGEELWRWNPEEHP